MSQLDPRWSCGRERPLLHSQALRCCRSKSLWAPLYVGGSGWTWLPSQGLSGQGTAWAPPVHRPCARCWLGIQRHVNHHPLMVGKGRCTQHTYSFDKLPQFYSFELLPSVYPSVHQRVPCGMFSVHSLSSLFQAWGNSGAGWVGLLQCLGRSPLWGRLCGGAVAALKGNPSPFLLICPQRVGSLLLQAGPHCLGLLPDLQLVCSLWLPPTASRTHLCSRNTKERTLPPRQAHSHDFLRPVPRLETSAQAEGAAVLDLWAL